MSSQGETPNFNIGVYRYRSRTGEMEENRCTEEKVPGEFHSPTQSHSTLIRTYGTTQNWSEESYCHKGVILESHRGRPFDTH